jgi:hypothetical protein
MGNLEGKYSLGIKNQITVVLMNEFIKKVI